MPRRFCGTMNKGPQVATAIDAGFWGPRNGCNITTLLFVFNDVLSIRDYVQPAHIPTLLALTFEAHCPFISLRLAPTAFQSMLVLADLKPTSMHSYQHCTGTATMTGHMTGGVTFGRKHVQKFALKRNVTHRVALQHPAVLRFQRSSALPSTNSLHFYPLLFAHTRAAKLLYPHYTPVLLPSVQALSTRNHCPPPRLLPMPS